MTTRYAAADATAAYYTSDTCVLDNAAATDFEFTVQQGSRKRHCDQLALAYQHFNMVVLLAM